MFEKTILRAVDVASILGVSLPTLYRWIRGGSFPRGFKYGGNTVGWTRETVESWISAKQNIPAPQAK
jgi:prophage regulatory protein